MNLSLLCGGRGDRSQVCSLVYGLEILCGKVLSRQQSCLLSSRPHSFPSRFMSWGRFNKLRFNIGLLPKLWSYFKQIWKERRSYNFYSFYGHWVTSFFTLSERYCQYPIFSWRKSKWYWYIIDLQWTIYHFWNDHSFLTFLTSIDSGRYFLIVSARRLKNQHSNLHHVNQ